MGDRFSNRIHIEWSTNVKKRDAFRCQICRDKGGELHSHHKNSYAYYYNQRYDLSNGITLCEQCHELFHSLYGKNISTRSQFEEFQKITQLLIKFERIKLGLNYE